MMMECPRCKFTQPKDQYCAQCGLDVEHYVAKPTPPLIRLMQNPNFHLSLIGLLIVVLAGYIVVTQGTRIGRNMGLITSRPLSSREAGDPNETKAEVSEPVAAAKPPEAQNPAPDAAQLAAAAPAVANDKPVAPKKESGIEITSYEIPKEALPALLADAQHLADGTEGRAYIWTSPSKIGEMLQNGGRPLGHPHKMAEAVGTQLAIETPPGPPQGFQFGVYFQIDKDTGLRWDSSLVLAAGDPADPNARSLAEANLAGQAPLATDSTVMLVFDPAVRTPREDSVRGAGPGPWSVFNSPDFRSGTTVWVMLVQMK